MDLKLYQHIRKSFLREGIDLFDKSTQEKIEAYDKSIGLDEKIEIHKEGLMADWQLAVSGNRVFKIDPLK
jgi:hypothetical protein